MNNDNNARDLFNLINLIITAYADDDIDFRHYGAKSTLIKTILFIITDPLNENSESEFLSDSVNRTIRSLYNITRIESEMQLFKNLNIASILMQKINKITCERTKVCAILCLSWTLQSDEIIQIKSQTNMLEDVSFESGIVFAFGLLDRALQSGSQRKDEMFRCFLGEYGKLPYYWAYEIADVQTAY